MVNSGARPRCVVANRSMKDGEEEAEESPAEHEVNVSVLSLPLLAPLLLLPVGLRFPVVIVGLKVDKNIAGGDGPGGVGNGNAKGDADDGEDGLRGRGRCVASGRPNSSFRSCGGVVGHDPLRRPSSSS